MSRLTIVYFIFSILHCVVQVVLQVRAFGINQEASSMLVSMINQGNATVEGFTVLGTQLRLCQTVPHTLDVDSCQVVWAGTPLNQVKANATTSAPPGASTVSLAQPTTATSAPANNVEAVSIPIAVPITPTDNPVVNQAAAVLPPTPSTAVLAAPTPPSTPSLKVCQFRQHFLAATHTGLSDGQRQVRPLHL